MLGVWVLLCSGPVAKARESARLWVSESGRQQTLGCLLEAVPLAYLESLTRELLIVDRVGCGST